MPGSQCFSSPKGKECLRCEMVLSVQFVIQYVIFHLILAQKGFLTISLLTFRARKFFVVRSYPVHRRMLSSIPATYPLGASSIHTPSSYDNSICLQTLLHVPCKAKLPSFENHCFKFRVKCRSEPFYSWKMILGFPSPELIY